MLRHPMYRLPYRIQGARMSWLGLHPSAETVMDIPGRDVALRLVRKSLTMCLCLSGSLVAQTGRIAGSVRTTDDEPISNARVVIAALGRSVVSGASGTFTFSNVPPGL